MMLRKILLSWVLLTSVASLALAAETPRTARPPNDTSGEQTQVAVPEPSPLAMQYYRSGNWLWGIGQLWGFAVPALLLWSGASAKLRTASQRIGRSWFLTIGVYVILYLVVVFIATLPLRYYAGFVRQHAYGLSNQSLPRWLGESSKALAVEAVVGFLFTWVPFLLIARRPRSWWLSTTLLTVPFLFVAVLIKPIWIDPLFNDFGPMKDQVLELKIVALAQRAGIGGSKIFEVDKSHDTNAMNAYVTGIFGTERIVLWDTLLAKLDDNQVLAVMGHEMGHYVLGHIPRSVLLSTFITLAGLFWVDRAGRWLIAKNQRRFGFENLSDVAAVPLILFLMHTSSIALVPFANAYSRYQEHEADRFALEITRTNRSAAQAFATLQRENLSNPRPGLFFKAWRSTHPSIAERIEFCNSYRPWETGKPLRYESLWRH